MKKIIIFFALAIMGCDDVFEKDISDSTVEIVAPKDGVTVPSGKVSFVWRETQGATSYRLTVVSPTFERAAVVVADTVLRADSLHTGLRFDVLMIAGDYQWSLQPGNSGYTGKESVQSFIVAPAEIPVPAP